MAEPLITYESALASLTEAVEAYATDRRPATFDAMEAALENAKQLLRPSSVGWPGASPRGFINLTRGDARTLERNDEMTRKSQA